MALPATINTASPANTDSPAQGDDQIRALKTLIVDLFGFPTDPTPLTAAPFSISAGGVVTVSQGNLVFQVGTVSAPSFGFSGRLTTGAYSSGADTFDIAAGGVRAASFATAASGVNYLTVTPAATGSGPILDATGSDTNIDLNLDTKGTGALNFKTAGTLRAFVNATGVGGSVSSGGDLTLFSTTHATKGSIIFGAAGSAVFDEVNTRFGIGTATPSEPLHLVSTVATDTSAGAIKLSSSQGTPRNLAFAFGGGDTGFVGATSDHAFDIITNGLPRIRASSAGLVAIAGVSSGPAPVARLHLFDDPAMVIDESASTPTGIAGLTDGAQCGVYMKANKFVIAYNDAGTLRYKTLTLSGTGDNWVHSTSAP